MLLGKRIKALRKEKGLTQEELGKLINVTKVSICCYEKGTRIPTIETLISLSKIFNVDLNYFAGFDNYVIAENDSEYTTYLTKEELEFISELKKYNSLYEQIIKDPKRIAELIYMKMR